MSKIIFFVCVVLFLGSAVNARVIDIVNDRLQQYILYRIDEEIKVYSVSDNTSKEIYNNYTTANDKYRIEQQQLIRTKHDSILNETQKLSEGVDPAKLKGCKFLTDDLFQAASEADKAIVDCGQSNLDNITAIFTEISNGTNAIFKELEEWKIEVESCRTESKTSSDIYRCLKDLKRRFWRKDRPDFKSKIHRLRTRLSTIAKDLGECASGSLAKFESIASICVDIFQKCIAGTLRAI